MGTTKHHIHDPSLNNIAGVLKALAHPTRLAIVRYLLENKSCSNKELVEHIQDLSQSNVSQHVKELKAMNIVQATPYNTAVRYTLHLELLNQIVVVLSMFLGMQ